MNNKMEWIPITTREPNDEEREYYEEKYGYIDEIFTCPLPEDDEDVLITTTYGDVTTTTFFNDEFGGYFECYEDDVTAWMKLPSPYQGDKK